MVDSRRLIQLAGDIEADREDLDRILEEARLCLDNLSTRVPSYLEVRGAGGIVHDFYNVVEHIFERVAIELNGGVPAGRDSHAQLLRRMSRPLDAVRPAVIDESMRSRLHPYLRFRHLFRHGYGFSLEWVKLVPLMEGMAEMAAELRQQITTFTAAVQALAERLE
jgi:hypothetical protein